MFTIIEAMAELERNVIRERVMAGLEYARQHGTKSGKAVGRPKRIFDRAEVARLRESGLSIEKIARQMGIGVGTVARVIQLQKRGTVLGDRSAGAVMESEHHDHHVGLDREIYYGDSLTVANIIMSDGESLEHVGVTPDEFLVPSPGDLAAGRDPVLARAVELAGGKISTDEAGKLFPVQWARY